MTNSAVLFVLVILAYHCHLAKGIVHLPTFSWDANNPLFKCENPVIRMPVNFQLDVHCPQTSIHNYLRDQQFIFDIPKIRMVQALDEEHFNKCDATGAKGNLHCGESEATNGQKCELPGRGCTPYYNILTGVVANRLVPGKTYYFIGSDSKGNTSSCKGNNGEKQMKLKIYVCTEEETKEGRCEPCQTEACYYKACSEECEDWVPSKVYKDLADKCYQHQTKTCTNALTATSTNRTRVVEVNCPEPICNDWQNDGLTKYEKGQCVIPQQRQCTLDGVKDMQQQNLPVTCPVTTCTDWRLVKTTIVENPKSCFKTEKATCIFEVASKNGILKIGYEDNREQNITCPQPTFGEKNTPKVLAREDKEPAESVDKYIYITIGASIGALVIGIVIGYCLTRLCQEKHEPIEVVKTVEKVIPMEGIGPIMSYDNKNFHLDPVLEDTQSFSMGDIAFIPTQEIGTKRQVMVARSVSFYNPDAMHTGGHNPHYNTHAGHKTQKTRKSSDSDNYCPPRTIHESRRNVMRHPSATSKSVLIRNHSDVTERPRSDSDSSVFNLKAPEDRTSEEV